MQETDPLFRTTSNNNSNSYPFYAPVTTTTTTTMNGYDNDETVEERDEESAADEDFGLVDHRPRRRRYLEGGNGDGQPWFMLYLTWMMIGTMLVIGVLGLFAWKRHESSPLHPSSASIGEFDTYNTSPTSSSSSSSQQLDGDSSSSSSWFHKKDPEPAAATRTTFSASLFGKETLETLMKDAGVVKPHHVKTVHYDPSGVLQAVNPFDFQMPDTYTSSVLLPGNVFHKDDDDTESGKLGYFQHPSIVNNQLIFCAEGDVFVTHLNKNTEEQHHMPATKLTTTVGNVLDPKWHPSLQYLAYTATYSGSRDLYLMDLKKGGHSMRLTYWDLDSGVTGLVGWWGNSLVFRAVSNDASLRDSRLYVLHLDNISPEDVDRNLKKKHQSSGPVSVLSIDPIPLSQAIDAARYDDCWYFVRYSQSSHTIRYVGGTTEQLWKYCDSEKSSERLIDDGYRGTSKSPQVYQSSAGRNYLFFLSDRKMIGSKNDKEWQPDRMNIWAYDLKMEDEDGAQFAAKYLIQITDTACDFEGRLIQEYTIDAVTGNVVARIGADLYLLGAETIETKLKKRRRRQLADDDGSEDSPGPSPAPSEFPSERPSSFPSEEPTTTEFPSELPNEEPSEFPSEEPSNFPSNFPLKSGEAEEGEVKEKPNENAGEKEGKDKKDTPSQEAEEKEKEGEEASSVYYNYLPAETKALAEEPYKDHHSGTSTELTRLRIMVHSDFYTHHERLLPVNVLEHLSTADVYETTVGTTHFLMTLRGQLWVAPVVDDELPTYEGAGRNMPERRYRVAPGAMMGGLVRILTALHVPNPVEDDETDRRLAVVLATDPLSETAEHAFYLIETQSDTTPSFLDVEHLPIPFLGGHVSGGSAKDGGLGSVKIDSLTLSPCGRRMAWTDTDGRIAVMNLPQYQDMSNRDSANFVLLPNKNEMGEPMMGDEVDLVFSPGGRYLAVNHHASNQFDIISIVDLGDAQGENKVADINVGRIVQATPSRFNSESMYWGKTTMDISVYARDAAMAEVFGTNEPADVATTLYFLSDRDIKTDVTSPWGTRQPLPHFAKSKAVYALPLMGYDDMPKGRFAGGGASELLTDKVLERKKLLQSLLDLMNSGGDGSGSSGSDGGSDDNKRRLAEKQKFVKSFHPLTGAFGIAEKSFGRTEVEQQQQRTLTKEDQAETDATMRKADFPKDLDIDFGPVDLTFGRRAYRVANIPEANYYEILCQTPDNGSLVLVEASDGDMVLTVYLADDFPSDKLEAKPFTPVIRTLAGWGLR